MEMRSTYRHCLRCDVLYLVGQYRTHQRVCAKTTPRWYDRRLTPQQVMTHLGEGLTVLQIARLYEVSPQWVYQLKKEVA